MSKAKPPHPHSARERQALWRVVERGVKSLVKNGDIEELTAREYVVGYLTKLLSEAGFIQSTDSSKADRPARVASLRPGGTNGRGARRAGVA